MTNYNSTGNRIVFQVLTLLFVLLIDVKTYANEHVFTNEDLSKYGGESSSGEPLEDRRPQQFVEPLPFGARPLEKKTVTYREAVTRSGLEPALANMKLGFYMFPEERERIIGDMTREAFCKKANMINKARGKGLKCYAEHSDFIIGIDFSLGELCHYFMEKDAGCRMTEPYSLEVLPSESEKPSMYYIFENVNNCLVLDRILDRDQQLLFSGAEAGGEIRSFVKSDDLTMIQPKPTSDAEFLSRSRKLIERVRKDLEKDGWQHLMTRSNVQFYWKPTEVSMIANALYRVSTIEFFDGDTLYQKVVELNCGGRRHRDISNLMMDTNRNHKLPIDVNSYTLNDNGNIQDGSPEQLLCGKIYVIH